MTDPTDPTKTKRSRKTAAAPEPPLPPLERSLALLRQMQLIRAFEEKLRSLFSAGQVPGLLHLCAGQEAVAVGVCAELGASDVIASNHRGHGHCLAKGVDPNEMMAELFGRIGGTSRGKGGSMHIADFSVGMLGANGIVGLETAFGLTITALVEAEVLSLTQAIALLTCRPASVFRLPKGTLSIGADADVAIVDPRREWVVDVKQFASKSKNSPFDGWKLRGQVVATIAGGRVVWELPA